MHSANCNAADLLAVRAAVHPDRPALIEHRDGGRRCLTFHEVKAATARAAGQLRQLGVEVDDRVLLTGPYSLDLYIAVFACWQVGAVAVLADSSGSGRLEEAVETTEPRALLSGGRSGWFRRLHPNLRRIPIRTTLGPALHAEGRRKADAVVDVAVKVAEEHPALITFDSAAAGAVVRSHGFLLCQFHALQSELRPHESDVDMPMQPLLALNNLAAGITTVLPPVGALPSGSADPSSLYHQLTREKVTTASGSPAHLEALAAWCSRQGCRLPLRAVFVDDGPVLPSLVRLLRETVDGRAFALFGQPEALPIACIDFEQLYTGATNSRPGVPGGICAGSLNRLLNLRIVHPHPEPIRLGAAGWAEWEEPRGEIGEIVVTGPHVLPPQSGHDTAPMREIVEGDRRWRRTGEAGWIDPEGRLWLMGSLGQRVRRAGRDWWPIPAEVAAGAVPPISHACFLGDPEGAPEQQAYLCVETPGGRLSETQRQRVMTAVAPTPVDQLVVLPQIPRDPCNPLRTDLAALRALLQEGAR